MLQLQQRSKMIQLSIVQTRVGSAIHATTTDGRLAVLKDNPIWVRGGWSSYSPFIQLSLNLIPEEIEPCRASCRRLFFQAVDVLR